MLFNSYEFIFLFLPAVMLLYFVLAAYERHLRLGLLLAASLAFYAYWDYRFVGLLACSMLGNFLIGGRLTRAVKQNEAYKAKLWLAAGVTANLLVLGFFKYANFFAENISFVTGGPYSLAGVILPLGISFFTFEQIGYLVDIKRGHVYPADPLSYAVFVSFFPRLVAGPVLRYSEIEPQLAPGTRATFSLDDLAIGLTIFFIGLAKKSFLADGVGQYVAPGFSAAQAGQNIDFFLAWGSVLAYTCQLYFDFSGYSDMAIGAARCFGIRFPVNFASPYKATNIVEFWRRWHITLSRFLRDYLYIPLGGNRHGGARRYVNLLVTMLLGGLWHGANWTFVCWGGLHGIYLMVNHAWTALARRVAVIDALRSTVLWRPVGWLLTFISVVIAWVFFRSPDFASAVHMLKGMSGANGAQLPAALSSLPYPAREVLAYVGVRFGSSSGTVFVSTYLWITALLTLALTMPNTQELVARFDPCIDDRGLANTQSRLYGIWSFSPRWSLALGAIAFLGLLSIVRVSEFLYWQF